MVASFTSTLPVTGALLALRSDDALSVSASALPALILPNTPVPVTFTLSLSAAARAPRYAASCTVVVGGEIVPVSLPIVVTNLYFPPMNSWSPDPLIVDMAAGTGQSAQVMGVFTTSLPITGATAVVIRETKGLTVTAGAMPDPIVSGQSFTLSLGLALDASAHYGEFDAVVQVMSNGQPVGTPLPIAVIYRQIVPHIYWTPALITGTLTSWQTVTYTVSFTSATELDGATLDVSGAGRTLRVTTSDLPAIIAAGQVVNVTLAFTSGISGKAAFDGDIHVEVGKTDIPDPLRFLFSQAQ